MSECYSVVQIELIVVGISITPFPKEEEEINQKEELPILMDCLRN